MTSRATWQVAGLIFMAAGTFGKKFAVFASMPDPVVGGLLVIGLGMVVSVGLSNLQFVDLSSGKKHIILGISILLGFAVPLNLRAAPDILNTGCLNRFALKIQLKSLYSFLNHYEITLLIIIIDKLINYF